MLDTALPPEVLATIEESLAHPEQWVTRERPKRPAMIIDIDGTVALRGDRGPFDWDLVHRDRPNAPVITVVALLREAGFFPLFVSGRDAVCRWDTLDWMMKHGVIPNDWTEPDDRFRLFMRPLRDNRPDYVVKDEIYRCDIERRWNVQFVFDDRLQVVKMWREVHGLTVFDVAGNVFPGDTERMEEMDHEHGAASRTSGDQGSSGARENSPGPDSGVDPTSPRGR